MFSPKVIVVIPSHPANAMAPIFLTESLIDNDVIVHPAKAPSPISSKASSEGNVIELSFLQLLNAFLPIDLRLFEKLICVNSSQSANALSPMDWHFESEPKEKEDNLAHL